MDDQKNTPLIDFNDLVKTIKDLQDQYPYMFPQNAEEYYRYGQDMIEQIRLSLFQNLTVDRQLIANAIDYLDEFIGSTCENDIRIGKTYLQIGACYQMLGHNEMAIEYYKKAKPFNHTQENKINKAILRLENI